MNSYYKNNCVRMIALVGWILWFPQYVSSQPTARANDEFLQHAIEIANWLDSIRTDEEDKTVWPSVASQTDSVSYNLYNGTSGIVLFYLQLYRSTGNAKYLGTAERGANSLLAYVETLDAQSEPGYWTGYTGVGVTLAEVYRATKREKYLRGCRRCFRQLQKIGKPIPDSRHDGLQFNQVTDIIAGSAGIGFALLYADEVLQEDGALELAIRVGDGLLDSGKPVYLEKQKITGVKWMMTPDYPREMPNYSHGTAGVCDFLLALDDCIVGRAKDVEDDYDGRFKNTASAGASYLQSIADLNDDQCFIEHHRDAKTEQGNEPPLYYLGWCHGPTGTNQLFLNLARKNPAGEEWKDLAKKGANSLLNSGIPEKRLAGFWNNVGVCCGSSGIGSHAIDLFRVTGDPRLKEFAIRLAHDTVQRGKKHLLVNDQSGLSWSHAEHRVRPDFLQEQTGLMQGAAGIGLWFLKLDAALNKTPFDLGIPMQPLRRLELSKEPPD